MASRALTRKEVVRDISEFAERIGAKHNLSEEQIFDLKLRTAAWYGGQPMEMGGVKSKCV